jgi:transposase InsO family protein
MEEGKGRVPPIETTVVVDGTPLQMEIDTGASVSLISSKTFETQLGSRPQLQTDSTQLRTYSGELVPVLGRIQVHVEVEGAAKQLPLLVVKGSGSNLIGRDWLACLQLDWRSIKQVRHHNDDARIRRMMDEYAEIFEPGLGKYTGPAIHLQLKPDARPRFQKARSVPFSLKAKVEEQLDKEIAQGVLKPVSCSDYASPIVPVLKADGSVRICADFKRTVNLDVEPDTCPLPRIEEVFAKLAGGQRFSKLDLSQAYSQLPLDESSQQLCTVNTTKGLLRYTRLPFGVAPAVGIFQRRMDCLLQGIQHVACFIDDLIVTGPDDETHLKSLEQVLQRLQQSGLKCGREKCSFMQESVSYLGHPIDASGLHPLQDKVRAIVRAPAPQDATQLRSFLGLVNYYGKFLPNLSSVLAPLHGLLNQAAKWHWTPAHEDAFVKCKTLLSSSPVLAHFDEKKQLVLECDASQYGIGAVICHRIDGVDMPIAFASRSLHDAESRYSQLEKEALAIVFGVKKFHAFLYGRRFTLISDHKPLLGLLHESKPIPPLASGRIQRWALILAGCSYEMQHRAGRSLLRADALSRLPLPEKPREAPTPAEVVLVMDQMDEGPVTARQIRVWTRTDPDLSQALRFTETGQWPQEPPLNLRPFCSRADELSVQDGCLMWGNRVVVPKEGRKPLLRCLHQGHQGASKMKALARSIFWWPKLDADIEHLADECRDCQEMRRTPAPYPLQPWAWPDRPWSRLHIDYAGPVQGRMLLVLVDAHSKWMDVHVMPNSTTSATIQRLRQNFATHGLPDILVSDNGTNLVSEEMRDFLVKNGIQHVRTAPYHPSSNGQAERAVQTLKRSLAKQRAGDLEERVSRFLLTYRTTPHSTTGVAPCELLMGRRLHSLLDRVRPDLPAVVERQQAKQKERHDQRARHRPIAEGDSVLAKDFADEGKWKPAVVTTSFGAARQFPKRRGFRRWDSRFDTRS